MACSILLGGRNIPPAITLPCDPLKSITPNNERASAQMRLELEHPGWGRNWRAKRRRHGVLHARDSEDHCVYLTLEILVSLPIPLH
jgi:hypothetical protein